MDEDGGWGVVEAGAGEVAQDEGEGAVGLGACEEDAGVDLDEALSFMISWKVSSFFPFCEASGLRGYNPDIMRRISGTMCSNLV